MTLENKYLSEKDETWEFQNYKWMIPADNNNGDMETFFKTDPDCKFVHFYSSSLQKIFLEHSFYFKS